MLHPATTDDNVWVNTIHKRPLILSRLAFMLMALSDVVCGLITIITLGNFMARVPNRYRWCLNWFGKDRFTDTRENEPCDCAACKMEQETKDAGFNSIPEYLTAMANRYRMSGKTPEDFVNWLNEKGIDARIEFVRTDDGQFATVEINPNETFH